MDEDFNFVASANFVESKIDVHDVKRAENRADRLEWEAEFTIDYAIASVESEVCRSRRRRRPPGRRRSQASIRTLMP